MSSPVDARRGGSASPRGPGRGCSARRRPRRTTGSAVVARQAEQLVGPATLASETHRGLRAAPSRRCREPTCSGEPGCSGAREVSSGAGADEVRTRESACTAEPCTRQQNRGTRNPWFETRERRIPQDANGSAARALRPCLASGDVESHFHVEGDLSDLGLGPGHVLAPSVKMGQPENQTIHSRTGPCKKKMHRPDRHCPWVSMDLGELGPGGSANGRLPPASRRRGRVPFSSPRGGSSGSRRHPTVAWEGSAGAELPRAGSWLARPGSGPLAPRPADSSVRIVLA